MLTFAVVWRPKYSRSCHQSISARLNHLAEDSAQHQHCCQLQNCRLFINKQIEQRADTQACTSLQRHVARPLWRWPSNCDQKQWAHDAILALCLWVCERNFPYLVCILATDATVHFDPWWYASIIAHLPQLAHLLHLVLNELLPSETRVHCTKRGTQQYDLVWFDLFSVLGGNWDPTDNTNQFSEFWKCSIWMAIPNKVAQCCSRPHQRPNLVAKSTIYACISWQKKS